MFYASSSGSKKELRKLYCIVINPYTWGWVWSNVQMHRERERERDVRRRGGPHASVVIIWRHGTQWPRLLSKEWETLKPLPHQSPHVLTCTARCFLLANTIQSNAPTHSYILLYAPITCPHEWMNKYMPLWYEENTLHRERQNQKQCFLKTFNHSKLKDWNN